MRAGLTELVFILDKSGSMTQLKEDTIGGYNSMINKQKKLFGETYVTTVVFNNGYDILHNHIELSEIQGITDEDYYTYGTTALLDAVGVTINSIGNRLNKTAEEERPSKVIVVIMTDGLENASKEFTIQEVKEMIQHQQEKYNWDFIFLGGTIETVKEAVKMGISADFSRQYKANKRGTEKLFNNLSDALTCMRSEEYDRNKKNKAFSEVMIELNKIQED